jgi:esterase/lipase superfamily enzyme
MSGRHFFSCLNRLFVLLPVVPFLLAGCSSHEPPSLMTTPVIYTGSEVDPFAHLDPGESSTVTSVFYATNRIALNDDHHYSNRVSDYLHLGRASVRMGDGSITWKELHRLSLAEVRPGPVPLFVEQIQEAATLNPANAESPLLALPPGLQAYVDTINHALGRARDKEIMLYIHGTKNSFEDAVVLTAELDYFTGRDFVSFAFAWPSHQNIFDYFWGTDVRRALHSTLSLHTMIDFLSRYTDAKHINILCYSAGGRITSEALYELYRTHSSLEKEELRRTFRIGTVVFAAADVPLERFLERLPAISKLAENIVVTVSDADDVLRAASRFMEGGERIGSEEAGQLAEKFVREHQIDNFELIDLSKGKEQRGFDITGHHYWYRHPWASSDVIFLLRTSLPAAKRGLVPAGDKQVWYLDSSYPLRIRHAAKRRLHDEW